MIVFFISFSFKMPDYANTVIYKISCKDTNITDIYVGSTTNIKNRIRHHKDSCNYPKNKHYYYKVYEFIRNNGGFDNWDIIVLEEYPCNSFSDAVIKEREYYETLKPTLNSRYPQRTYKEYCNENKEYKKEYDKNYRIINNEKRKEQKNQYYNDNKKEINEKRKQYRIDNKEKINEKIKEKIICECGYEITKCNLKRHQKSAKHFKLLMC